MRSRSIAVRVLVGLILLPIVTLSTTASGYSLYRCRMTETVRSACCCPADGRAASPNASIGSRCCCDVVHVDLVQSPSSRSASSHDVVVLVTALLPGLLAPAVTAGRFAPDAVGSVLGLGPPLILLKHSRLL